MMLRYSLNRAEQADRIENAVKKVLAQGYRTGDILTRAASRSAPPRWARPWWPRCKLSDGKGAACGAFFVFPAFFFVLSPFSRAALPQIRVD